ncbi:MAG TPA: TlpA disulfide reductase family protein [Phycisphaerales bacterium]|nr:TlpA disulfide reductase family protein [Phycisphaerales bacterium]
MSPLMHKLGASLAVSLVLASTSTAQVDRFNKPRDQRQPETKQPAKAPAKEVKWPATPVKDLNAQKDFRNKKPPAFKVEKWLNKEPDRENRVVLIDFWATWCGPCRRVIPELKAWQEKYKDDLVVIGISNEAPREVENFMRAQQITYAMAIDTKQTMSKAIGIGGIPHVLVISSDGIVRWQGFPGGEDPLTEEKLAQIIEADKAMRARAEAEAQDTQKPDAAPEKDKPRKTTAPERMRTDRPARTPTDYTLPDSSDELRAHIEKLRQQRKDIEADNARLRAKIKELEGKKDADGAITGAYLEISANATKLTKLNAELDAAEAKLKTLKP